MLSSDNRIPDLCVITLIRLSMLGSSILPSTRREGRRLRYRKRYLVSLEVLSLTSFKQNYDFPNNCEDYIHRIGRTGVRVCCCTLIIVY
jgi:hypothetical protein